MLVFGSGKSMGMGTGLGKDSGINVGRDSGGRVMMSSSKAGGGVTTLSLKPGRRAMTLPSNSRGSTRTSSLKPRGGAATLSSKSGTGASSEVLVTQSASSAGHPLAPEESSDAQVTQPITRWSSGAQYLAMRMCQHTLFIVSVIIQNAEQLRTINQAQNLVAAWELKYGPVVRCYEPGSSCLHAPCSEVRCED